MSKRTGIPSARSVPMNGEWKPLQLPHLVSQAQTVSPSLRLSSLEWGGHILDGPIFKGWVNRWWAWVLVIFQTRKRLRRSPFFLSEAIRIRCASGIAGRASVNFGGRVWVFLAAFFFAIERFSTAKLFCRPRLLRPYLCPSRSLGCGDLPASSG